MGGRILYSVLCQKHQEFQHYKKKKKESFSSVEG